MAGSNAYYYSQRVRKGPIHTKSVAPTRATGGVTSRGPIPQYVERAGGTGRPTPQYVERESRNVADDKMRAAVLAALGQGVNPGGPGGKPGLPGGATSSFRLPKVPVEPVQGNPYKGLPAAISRFGAASSKRQQGDIAAAKKALAGRQDPGAATTGSFNAQAVGMAGELASTISQLRNQARQDYATTELERRGQLAKNKFEARSAQIKNDAQLLQDLGGGGLTPSMIVQLEAEGIDSQQFMNNPQGAMVALGRARYARRYEISGLPATAYAQASQYGMQLPSTYGTPENFYYELGKRKAGTYGDDTDVMGLIAQLKQGGLLEGLPNMDSFGG